MPEHEGPEPIKLVHIRQPASRVRRGNQFYRDRNYAADPQRLTLCGAPATDRDMSHSETHWAKNLVYVTCARCLALRNPATTDTGW
jgi:hypothetical protein